VVLARLEDVSHSSPRDQTQDFEPPNSLAHGIVGRRFGSSRRAKKRVHGHLKTGGPFQLGQHGPDPVADSGFVRGLFLDKWDARFRR